MNQAEDLETILEQLISEMDLRICEAEEKLFSHFDRIEHKLQVLGSELNGNRTS